MTRAYSLISRNKVLISLLAIIVLCLLLRFLHLLDFSHYYILSVDSHFFHWVSERYLMVETADRFMDGNQITTNWHTGLSYPLAWISIALASVFSLSRTEALTWAAKLLPPLLGVIGALLMYWMGSQMYSRRVGIFAAFSWAVVIPTVYITSAGYIDRDALSVLLITAGVFMFYLSKDWQYTIGKLNVGWTLAALLVAGIEFLLFLEWGWAGPVLLLVILMVYFAAVFLARFYAHISPILTGSRELPDLVSSVKLVYTNIVTAWRETNWRPLALIVCLNILALLLVPDFTPSKLYAMADLWFNPTGPLATTTEAHGITLYNLFIYSLLTVAVLIGIFITLIRRSHPNMLWLSWFLVFFLVGLFIGRVFINYAAVACCMLSGLGLASLWSSGARWAYEPISAFMQVLSRTPRGVYIINPDSLLYRRLWRVGVVFFLIIQIFISFFVAYNSGSVRGIAADNDWYDALTYLKENTPEQAVIMTWWDYGYWILDIAQRTPVVDNGFRPEDRLRDIAQAYCTNQDSEAIEVAQKYSASYLIFSKIDIAVLPVISHYGLDQEYGDRKSIPPELEGSLFARALGENFDSDGSLVVAYRNDEVVILSVRQ